MIELYEFELSGNCHKARLMLNLLGLNYKSILIKGSAKEHKSKDYIDMNPFGQAPVLKDKKVVIRDSQAILVYLAYQYGGEKWWPTDAAKLANIMAWLSTAANEVANGPSALRKFYKFGSVVNLVEAQEITNMLLDILEAHLEKNDWIATDDLSIADIAIFPYIGLLHEGKKDLNNHPCVLAWTQRIKRLHGYVSMSGLENN